MKNIKEILTTEDIVNIVLSLGSENYKTNNDNELIFQTICHNDINGSYKLYYYIDSKLFHCYTECGESFDIHELIKKVRGYNYFESLIYIQNTTGIKINENHGFVTENKLTDDWSLINKYKQEEKLEIDRSQFIYNPHLIDYFANTDPIEWVNEGISKQSMQKFNIRFDVIENKIIIPHYNIDGELIGIRGRALNKIDILNGFKYMPIKIQDKYIKHALSGNLYGLNNNLDTIIQMKKILLFEAEKSVLKCDTFYNDSNFTVACCGSTITNYQRDLILSLGIKEVFIAFDKEYHEAFTPESDNYSAKIIDLANKFSPYVTTYVLWDIENLLEYKDAPCDKGQETLEKLLKNKYEVKSIEE